MCSVREKSGHLEEVLALLDTGFGHGYAAFLFVLLIVGAFLEVSRGAVGFDVESSVIITWAGDYEGGSCLVDEY